MRVYLEGSQKGVAEISGDVDLAGEDSDLGRRDPVDGLALRLGPQQQILRHVELLAAVDDPIVRKLWGKHVSCAFQQ